MRQQPARPPYIGMYLPESATTWVVVAHRSGAKAYEFITRGARPIEVREWEHPEGRLKEGEINSDKSGRQAYAGTTERHGVEPTNLATERVAKDFARQLADDIRDARLANVFEHLILVAEPKFLGYLRASLDEPTQKTIIGSESKNYDLEDRELPETVNRIYYQHIKDQVE